MAHFLAGWQKQGCKILGLLLYQASEIGEGIVVYSWFYFNPGLNL
ncbi:MAG: hypothetical protein V7K82_16290 [Nostoc sp.]